MVNLELKNQIMERYDAADRWLIQKRLIWSQYEDLFHNKLQDAISQETKSQVFDPQLSTLTLNRAFRVMAQLASGKVRGVGAKSEGAARIMDLALDKYVTPNASSQFDLLTKYRLMDIYSNIYGNYFSLVDWDIKPNGYIGPDLWLIPIRDVFPQVGAVSVKDSDYIIIQSWKPISYFEALAKEKMEGTKNLPAIIERLKNSTGDKQSRNMYLQDNRELQEYPTAQPAKRAGYFQVLSMYEGDRWTDYCVHAQMDFRDLKNPHENGELPVANKYAIPLLEDFMGMGDFERAKPLQMTTNSLWNLYLDAVKVSIFPPVLINKQAIADKSSIKWSAAAKWLIKGSPAAAAQTLSLTPQGINEFNNAMSAVKASLLNMFGTTDTTIDQKQDPGFGRTPAALNLRQQMQNSADTADRFYMEQFVNDVTRKFVNLLAKKSDSIEFDMFDEEIKEIAREFTEVKDYYDEKTGKIIFPNKNKSITYVFEMVPGSTYQADQQQQMQNLLGLFNTVIAGLEMDKDGNPSSPLLTMLEAEGKKVNIGELFTRLISSSGIQDWDKIIVDVSKQGAGILDEHKQKFLSTLKTMQMGLPSTPNGQAQPFPGMPQMPGVGQMANPQQQAPQNPGGNGPKLPTRESITIPYDKAPSDIQRQMEQAAGFNPSQQQGVTPQPANLPVNLPGGQSPVNPQMASPLPPMPLPPQIQMQQGGSPQ